MEGTRINHCFSPFYDEVGQHPELPRFRRFGPQWAKLLYDATEELLERENDLNDALSQMRGKGRRLLALNYPKVYDKDEDIKRLRRDFEESLVSYSTTSLHTS